MNGRGPGVPAPKARPELLHEGAEQTPVTLEVPSFKFIYAQYFDFVWSSARCLGIERAMLDDVVQEIFLVIHRKVHTLEQPQSLRSWIYGVARRTVRGYRRSRRHHDSSTALAHHAGTQPDAQPTPLELVEQNEEARILWELLEKIEPPKREVLVLVEIEGMTAPEIAEALEIPLNTVYSRLRAARSAFEAALARRAVRGEGGEGA
jgi:RNA polymerase sigma-70 factor (ECF subfamily)